MSSGETSRPGRPRDANAERVILRAAVTELEAAPFATFSVEGVARRAKVGKTTIYRRWPSRVELAVDAFLHTTSAELAFAESESAAGDFRAQLKQLARMLRGRRGAMLTAIINGARDEPALRRVVEQRWVLPRKAWGMARIARAAREGQLQRGAAVATCLDALYSPLYAHLFLGTKLHTDAELDALCDLVLPAMFTG